MRATRARRATRDALSGLPLEGLLFVGLAAIYEGAEMDPPVVGAAPPPGVVIGP